MIVTIEEQIGVEPKVIICCPDAHAAQIQALQHLLVSWDCRIPVQQQEDLLLLPLHEILYGEFVGRNVFLYTKDAVHPTSLSLKQLESDYSDFFRCSKSMVVNLSCIQRLRSEVGGRILAILSNGEKLLISRHYAGSLRHCLGCTTQKRGIL